MLIILKKKKVSEFLNLNLVFVDITQIIKKNDLQKVPKKTKVKKLLKLLK
jgi:hypothetical protein